MWRLPKVQVRSINLAMLVGIPSHSAQSRGVFQLHNENLDNKDKNDQLWRMKTPARIVYWMSVQSSLFFKFVVMSSNYRIFVIFCITFSQLQLQLSIAVFTWNTFIWGNLTSLFYCVTFSTVKWHLPRKHVLCKHGRYVDISTTVYSPRCT